MLYSWTHMATVVVNHTLWRPTSGKYKIVMLPAQRYASAGNRDRNVSVRPSVSLSVRPSRAGIVSKRRKLAS